MSPNLVSRYVHIKTLTYNTLINYNLYVFNTIIQAEECGFPSAAGFFLLSILIICYTVSRMWLSNSRDTLLVRG